MLVTNSLRLSVVEQKFHSEDEICVL